MEQRWVFFYVDSDGVHGRAQRSVLPFSEEMEDIPSFKGPAEAEGWLREYAHDKSGYINQDYDLVLLVVWTNSAFIE